MTPALFQACARALHVITPDGRILRAGRACAYILGAIGFTRTARLMTLAPVRPFVELGYWLVARNRHLLTRFIHD